MRESERLPPARDHGGRRYEDANGVVWRVRERQPLHLPPALYFETDAAFRRVTNYPADWRDLPTAELEILSGDI
jgi:hypothetical protein